MFNKTANTPPPRRPEIAPVQTEASGAARRPSPARAPSLLGPDLMFEGQISGEGELHIEGSVRGEIQVARLVIGERAQVEGAIRGGQIEVRGRVMGNIEAKSVKLYESADVEGDIVHEQLSIDVGAFFQGRCQQFVKPAAPPTTAPVTAAMTPSPQPAAKLVELEQAKG